MEAKIKLFENKLCSRELQKDSSGNYVIDFKNLSSRNPFNCSLNVYAKNVGTHKAYRLGVAIIQSNVPGMNIEFNKSTLEIGEICDIKVVFPIVKGQVGNHLLTIMITYDNV